MSNYQLNMDGHTHRDTNGKSVFQSWIDRFEKRKKWAIFFAMKSFTEFKVFSQAIYRSLSL